MAKLSTVSNSKKSKWWPFPVSPGPDDNQPTRAAPARREDYLETSPIGHYSIIKRNEEYKLSCDDDGIQQRKQFRPWDNEKLNLSDGFERCQFVDYLEDQDYAIDYLKQYLKEKVGYGQLKKQKIQTVVGLGGTITALATTPYSKYPWEHTVEKKDGILFIKKAHQANSSVSDLDKERQRMENFRAKRFELYMTNSEVNPETNIIIDPNEYFSAVYGTYLSAKRDESSPGTSTTETKLHLVHRWEIDAIDTEKYVELKTKTKKAFVGDRKPRFDLLQWYLQLRMTKIDRIVCGLRDDDNTVNDVREFDKARLEYEYGKAASGNFCLNFLHDLLNFIIDKVNEGEKRNIVYEKDSASNYRLIKLSRDYISI